MLKKMILIFISLISICLCSCMETPNDIIVNKIDASIDSEVSSEISANDKNLHWKEVFDSKDKQFKVIIDAEVIYPKKQILDKVKAIPRIFSDEEIGNVKNALIGAQKLYINKTGILTKETAEAMIIKLKQHQNEDNNIDSEIEAYMTMYDSLPLLADLFTLELSEYIFSNKSYDLITPNEKTTVSIFNIKNKISDSDVRIQYYSNANSMGYSMLRYQDTNDEIGIDLEKAQELAVGCINQSGIIGYSLRDRVFVCDETDQSGYIIDSNKIPCYVFIFTREYEYIPVSFINKFSGSTENLNVYRSSWTPEHIVIRVNAEGISSFEWINPVEIANSSNQSLLPFDHIQEIFRKFVMNPDHGVQIDSLLINEIKFGYMYVAVQNSPYFELTPVWDFMGYYPSNYYPEKIVEFSHLTINAFTGAIIQRNLGY